MAPPATDIVPACCDLSICPRCGTLRPFASVTSLPMNSSRTATASANEVIEAATRRCVHLAHHAHQRARGTLQYPASFSTPVSRKRPHCHCCPQTHPHRPPALECAPIASRPLTRPHPTHALERALHRRSRPNEPPSGTPSGCGNVPNPRYVLPAFLFFLFVSIVLRWLMATKPDSGTNTYNMTERRGRQGVTAGQHGATPPAFYFFCFLVPIIYNSSRMCIITNEQD